MDDQVIAAMARWPNVPAVFGWLRLDRRGQWFLIDRGVAGFDERLHGQGSAITSPPILDFIGRNYLGDARGRWYWQNGPQRVYVDLDLAPFVLRVLGQGPSARLVTHTGYDVKHIDAAASDAQGNLLLATDLGPGAVHDLDLTSLELLIDEGTPAAGAAGGGSDQPAGLPVVQALIVQGRQIPVANDGGASLPKFERTPRD